MLYRHAALCNNGPAKAKAKSHKEKKRPKRNRNRIPNQLQQAIRFPKWSIKLGKTVNLCDAMRRQWRTQNLIKGEVS